MEMQDLTNKIKSTRTALGISQEELAELSGLSLRSVQRIEGGQTTPRGDSLKRIAQALQLDVQDLTTPYAQQFSTVQQKPDKGIVIIMLLSAYSFMLHPLVGLAIPLLIFFLYKNTNPLVKKFGKRLIWLESIYCGFVGLFVGYMLTGRLSHRPLPEFIPFESTLILVMSMYVLHIVAISVLVVQFVRSTRVSEANAMQALQS